MVKEDALSERNMREVGVNAPDSSVEFGGAGFGLREEVYQMARFEFIGDGPIRQ